MNKKENIKNNDIESYGSDSNDNLEEDEENENSTDDDDGNDEYDSNLEINPNTFFTMKELCYYKLINKFFKGRICEEILKMINIIHSKSVISLRILDWFVTKYSKGRIDCGENDVEMFDVRISYKSQLKSYKKKYFDPFRRKQKFNYHFENGQIVKTTLGQLNFFKWAFNNNIVNYVEKHLKQIIREMKAAKKEIDKKKGKVKKETKKQKIEDSDSFTSTKVKVKGDNDNYTIKSIKFNIKENHKSDLNLTLSFD